MARRGWRMLLLAVGLFVSLAPPAGAARPGEHRGSVWGQQAPSPGAAAQRLLDANGFAVEPDRLPQPYDLYRNNYDLGLPSFVTSDLLLHVYHILYDYTLRDLELRRFAPLLRALTEPLLRTSAAQAAAATGDLAEAARRNVAYFGVALRLLDPQATIPADVRDLVEAELALIAAHSGRVRSPIFGRDEDYSQYVPRGHYTRNETFERYFRAMMWYGRMTFRLDDAQATQRALLLVNALAMTSVDAGDAGTLPAMEAWQRIYEPTVFFVGRADDLSVADYARLARDVWGGLPDATMLGDAAKLAQFVAAARALPPPQIVSTFLAEGQSAATTAGLRFMGQRFILDGYIFQRLIHDRVPDRYLGKGLDVMAAFGSERALAILTGQYGEDRYPGYLDEMAKLRAQIAAIGPDEWGQNLYWGWLWALAALDDPRAAPYPSFMRGDAWSDKQLNAALGSWTELRHDTILYAKQPYAAVASAPGPRPQPPRPVGYVEPQPELYARLSALAARTRDGLTRRGLLEGAFATKLAALGQLTDRLRAIAERELRGEAITAEDADLIRTIGSTTDNLTSFSAQTAGRITSETDERMAAVADVQTDPNSQRVLEEGVGDAFTIWVLAPIGAQPVLTRGAVFSYYEFPWPMGDRLTDEAWQRLSPKPPLPRWTASFTADGPFEP